MNWILRVIVFLQLIFPWVLDAQSSNSGGTIVGRVFDKSTHLPVGFASIEVHNKTFKSDSNGKYVVPYLAIGSVDLVILKEGYQTTTVNHVNVLPGKIVELNIDLEPEIEKVKAVVIDKMRNTNGIINPISSFEFNREEISMNPGAQGDIFRAIGMLPGVSSSGGIYSAISVRGQGVRDNVYMVDDIPVTEVGHLEGNSFFNDPNGGRFSIFAPRVIEKAQFQGGGFGAEFGRRSASYLGLTIKEGNQFNTIWDGQVDLLGLNVNVDGPLKGIKNTTVFLSMRYQNFLALVNVVGLKDIGLPRYGDIILKTTTQLNDKNKLKFVFALCPERYTRDINHVKADKNLNNVYLPDFNRNKIIGGLNLQSQINKRLKLKNVLYYTGYLSDVTVGKAFPLIDSTGKLIQMDIPYIQNIQEQEYEEHKLGFRSLAIWALGQNSNLTFGIEGDQMQLKNVRKQHFNDTQYIFSSQNLVNINQKYVVLYPQFINVNYNEGASNFSSYLSYSTVIYSTFSINAGVRYDYSGFSKQGVLAPRFSSSWFVSKGHSLSVSWGLYYQDPVFSEVADQGTNRLKLEKSRQFVASYKWNMKRNLTLMVEAWDKAFDQMATKPDISSVQMVNTGSGFGRGIDVSIMLKMLRKWGGQISYSFMETKRRDNSFSNEYNFAFSQPHQFNFLLNYKLNVHWLMSVKYRFATGKPSDIFTTHNNVLNDVLKYRYSKEITQINGSRLPNFNSLDLRVNYIFRVKKYTFTTFMDIVNVRNKQIANFENFNAYNGKPYFDGLAIFPTGGLKFEF